jgi:hypothetical protein
LFEKDVFIGKFLINKGEIMSIFIPFMGNHQASLVEALKNTGEFLSSGSYSLWVGTALTAVGACFLGLKCGEQKLSKRNVVASGALMTLGLGILGFTAFGISRTSEVCLDLASR